MKDVTTFDPVFDGISDLVDAAVASPEDVDRIKSEIHALLVRRSRLPSPPAPKIDDDPADDFWENVPL